MFYKTDYMLEKQVQKEFMKLIKKKKRGVKALQTSSPIHMCYVLLGSIVAIVAQSVCGGSQMKYVNLSTITCFI